MIFQLNGRHKLYHSRTREQTVSSNYILSALIKFMNTSTKSNYINKGKNPSSYRVKTFIFLVLNRMSHVLCELRK
jgi:hypothetical protein